MEFSEDDVVIVAIDGVRGGGADEEVDGGVGKFLEGADAEGGAEAVAIFGGEGPLGG